MSDTQSIMEIPAKTILSSYRAQNPWFGAHYSMNLYQGCCHGCIYCDSRSACYGIERFDTVRVKENALTVLTQELRAKRRTGVVATGSMSDPYNPFEKDLCCTRKALQLLHQYGFGAAIATKSDGITRDIDILQQISANAPVILKLTITTCDDSLAKKLEPHAPLPSQRFAALAKLSQAGLFCGILLMPVLPFLEDTAQNITGIIARAADAGVRFIYPAFGVTLRQNQRAYYYEQLDRLFPMLRDKYVDAYADAYECVSPQARQLWQLFTTQCAQYGILYRMPQIIDAYQQANTQLSLF